MIRLSSLAGLPVILMGRVVGRVEQAVLTGDARALRGLIVRQGLGAARWAAAESILLVGEVSVIVREKPGRLPKDADHTLTTVKDTGGMHLGRVTDVWLDPATRRVGALEVSLGLVETVTFGRVLAEQFTACPVPGDLGQVLIPCGQLLPRSDPRVM